MNTLTRKHIPAREIYGRSVAYSALPELKQVNQSMSKLLTALANGSRTPGLTLRQWPLAALLNLRRGLWPSR